MKVLIGCEISGIVRNAFLARGHDAWSCDILPSEDSFNRHIRDDIRRVIRMDEWDLLMVVHPPCTRLCNSGVRWLSVPPPGRSKEEMWEELRAGADLFSDVLHADIERVAVENPVMHRHAKALIRDYRPFAQSVHPWQFGRDPEGPDNVKKRTCLGCADCRCWFLRERWMGQARGRKCIARRPARTAPGSEAGSIPVWPMPWPNNGAGIRSACRKGWRHETCPFL